MKKSKKHLIQEIELQYKELQNHQLELKNHKNAMMTFLHDNKSTITACLLSLLYFLPWKKLSRKSLPAISRLVRQLAEIVAINTVNWGKRAIKARNT